MIKYIFSCLLLLSVLVVNAQENEYIPMEDPSEFKSGLKASIEGINSISSDFFQEKQLDIFEETIDSEGKFYFEKKNKVRWEYTAPIKYVIILNGEKVLLQSENDEKKYDLNSNKFMEKVNELMVGSIQGDLLDDDEMFDKEYFISDKYYIARLTPRDKNVENVLKQIEMFFNKKDYSVDKLKFFEYTGDFTDIVFKNKKFNESIPEDIFRID